MTSPGISLILTTICIVTGKEDGMLRNLFNQPSDPFLTGSFRPPTVSDPDVPYMESFPPIAQPQVPTNQLPYAGPLIPPYYPYRQIAVPSLTILPPTPRPIPPPEGLDFMVLFGNKFVNFKIWENLEKRTDSDAIKTELSQESETLPKEIPAKLAELVRPELKRVAEGIRDHIAEEKNKAAKWLTDAIKQLSSLNGIPPPPGPGPHIILYRGPVNGTVIVQLLEKYLEDKTELILDTTNQLIQRLLAEMIIMTDENDEFPAQPKPLFPWTGMAL